MSVFTQVTRDELQNLLQAYDLGRLVEFSGIEGGTENSNFFVTCEAGRFVLTLIEREPVAAELPFFVALLQTLHEKNLPVPYAICDRSGQAVHQLNGKPALLQPRLPGSHIGQPGTQHSAAVGKTLGALHAATSESGLRRTSDRGLDWMAEQGQVLLSRLDDEGRVLLEPLLATLEQLREERPAMPKAVLHADLFRDNVLFEGDHVSGIIDFYNAASGWMLYDVAICVNDWCVHEDGNLDPPRAKALLAAYAAQRRFTPTECEWWPAMLRLAALRFWLSRQIAARENAAQDVLIKDPEHFRRILAGHRQIGVQLPMAL